MPAVVLPALRRSLRGWLLGPVLMTWSALLFGGMNYFVKRASVGLPGAEIAFIRFAFGLALVLTLVGVSWSLRRIGLIAGTGITLSWQKWPLLVARGCLGAVAILLLYLALGAGNLTNVSVLSSSYSVFATLFGVALLRERPGFWAFAALGASLLGMGLMVGTLGAIGAGDSLALLSAVASGLAVVVVRELRRTESTLSVFSSLCVFGCIVCAAYGWRSFRLPRVELWWALGASVLGTGAQLSMTASYRHISASIGSILSMSAVLFSGLLGYAFLGDRLTSPQIGGALLLVVGSVVVAMSDRGV